MKKFFTFIGAALLVASAAQAQRNTLHPSVAAGDTSRVYQAPRATTAPVIDGDHTDAVWNLAPWKQAFAITPIDATSWPSDAVPVSPEGAFSGPDDVSCKYKIMWDADRYYMLLRWTDDNIIYSDFHSGYRTGSPPSYMNGVTIPATPGAGNGTAYQNFRMDMIQTWLTPYTPEIHANSGIKVASTGAATTFARANNSVNHTFLMGKLTSQSTRPEAVLWAPKHNPVSTTSGAPQTHQATVAGRFVASENAYYVELRDTTWSALFSTVRTKLSGQKDFANGPAIGDKFLLQGEVNDADGITNRRDYVNYFTHMTSTASKNPTSNMSEALVVELVEIVSGLKNAKANNSLAVYPNPVKSDMITLPRIADVQIFSLAGHLLLESKNSMKVNVSTLKQGVYMVKDNEGNVSKLIKE